MGRAQAGEQAAWNMFWYQNARGGAAGCLPEGWRSIEEAQRRVWQEFARGIPQGGAVLDLATGDGRVLAWIGAERSDLVLNGVDLAPTLPPPPPHVTLQGGVAMEDLPFPDHSQDAVTSRFGFEYGDTDRAAAEIARVLKPAGRIGLMMHRGDGPIAQTLVPRPADHGSAVYMATLSDEQLYLVIEKGGAAAGKSSMMAPWGGILNDSDIRDVIAHLRSLSGT